MFSSIVGCRSELRHKADKAIRQGDKISVLESWLLASSWFWFLVLAGSEVFHFLKGREVKVSSSFLIDRKFTDIFLSFLFSILAFFKEISLRHFQSN